MQLKFWTAAFVALHTLVTAQTTFNRTYHAPKLLVPNECGVVQKNKKGPVYIEFTYFNYCHLTSTEKDGLKNALHGFRAMGNKLVHKAADEFGWDVTAKFALRNAETCTIPEEYTGDIAVNGSEIAVHGDPTVIQINVLLGSETDSSDSSEDHADDIVSVIGDQLTYSRAASMLTISIMGAMSSHIKSKLDDTYSSAVYPFFAFENTNDALEINLGHFLSSIGCNPSYLGAVPYEVYDTATDEMNCQCVCPEGQQFKTESETLKVCKPIENHDRSGQCDWLAKCYAVKTGQSPNSDNLYNAACVLKDMFGTGVAQVPAPWDNYVFGKTNLDAGRAKITVTITSPTNDVKQQTYDWKTFQEDSAKVLNRDFTFGIEGVHKFQVEAKDYKRNAICETEIRITDSIRPVVPSTFTCPTKQEDAQQNTFTYTDGLTIALEQKDKFNAYVASRQNDNCGHGASCDSIVRKREGFGKDEYETVSSPTSWVLTDDDRSFLREISEDILKSNPGKVHKKCWNFFAQFGEQVTDYTCGAADVETCKLSTIDCEFVQCLKTNGEEFYESTIEIVPATQQRTTAINNMLHEAAFDPATSIHEVISETSVGTDPGEGTYETHLSELISIEHRFTDLAKDFRTKFDLSGSTDTTIHDIIKSRYSINAGGWKLWERGSKKNQVIFEQEQNDIVIESWSKFGRVKEISFTMIIHPHTPLDMCAEFQRSSFYQTLSILEHNPEHKYCSYPNSDFAEITFDFIHNVGLEKLDARRLPYHFQNITCSAYFMEENSEGGDVSRITDGALLLKLGGANLSFVERYGIDLKTDPTDRNTPVQIDCHLWYKSEENQEQPQHCAQTLTFEDCEAPRFPTEAESINFKKCSEGCPENALKPFSFCGGNHLKFQVANGENGLASNNSAIFTKEVATEKCCTNCGEYQCKSLVDTDLATTLKSCQLATPIAAALLEDTADEEMQQSSSVAYSSLALVAVLFVAAFVTKMTKKQKTQDEQNEGYSPLL